MRYRHAFPLDVDLKMVLDMHRDPDLLRQLTPPLLGFRWEHREPLAEGSRVCFSLGWGPLRLQWSARHRDVGEAGFVDEQVKGPFARWIHRHLFVAEETGRTWILDEIEAELPRHPLRAMLALGIWLGLPLLFTYRRWRLQRMLRERTP